MLWGKLWTTEKASYNHGIRGLRDCSWKWRWNDGMVNGRKKSCFWCRQIGFGFLCSVYCCKSCRMFASHSGHNFLAGLHELNQSSHSYGHARYRQSKKIKMCHHYCGCFSFGKNYQPDVSCPRHWSHQHHSKRRARRSPEEIGSKAHHKLYKVKFRRRTQSSRLKNGSQDLFLGYWRQDDRNSFAKHAQKFHNHRIWLSFPWKH